MTHTKEYRTYQLQWPNGHISVMLLKNPIEEEILNGFINPWKYRELAGPFDNDPLPKNRAN